MKKLPLTLGILSFLFLVTIAWLSYFNKQSNPVSMESSAITWDTFKHEHSDKIDDWTFSEGSLEEHRAIDEKTVLFSPDKKLVSFIVGGYESITPYLVDVNTGVNILDD